MSMKIIVGLGNPGSKYQWTRHNAGFMVLDRVSEVSGIPMARKKFSSFCGEGDWNDRHLLLLKPQTFMNLSGQSVAAALRFHKVPAGDVIVVHDDLDIPFGKVKMKTGGGHGGHNGLRSLISDIGSDFVRIRIGIGRPEHGDTVNYVLTNFGKDELPAVPKLVENVVDLLALYLKEGLGKAMSLYNGRDMLV